MIYTLLQTVGIEPYAVGHPLRVAGRASGWTALRQRHLRTNPVCIITGAKVNLDVHHVRPVHLFPELELDPSNLRTIRGDLHLAIGHCGNWSLWNADFDRCAEILAAAWRAARLPINPAGE